MNRVGAGTAGYTVVETMIFLAVSGVMIISAMLFMNGQQRKNEFATGIRDIQSQLTDIMNDVATGFYSNTGNFTCTAIGTNAPQIGSGTNTQGTNDDCTFVGRAIQFAPNDPSYGNESAVLYTLIGKRQTGTPGTDVRTIAEARPVVLSPMDTQLRLPYGIKIISVLSDDTTPTGTIAFVSRFGGNTGSGGITGTQDINLIPIQTSGLNQSITSNKAIIATALENPIPPPMNPKKGITLCFASGGTNQFARILLGGPNRQVSSQLTIGNNPC